jgi:hypothetical protein
MRKFLLLSLVAFLCACSSDGGSVSQDAAALTSPTTITHTCDPEAASPHPVGEVAVENLSDKPLEVQVEVPRPALRASDQSGHWTDDELGSDRWPVAPGETVGFGLFAEQCPYADQTVSVKVIDPESGAVVSEWTVTVKCDCPEPPPPPPPPDIQVFPICRNTVVAHRFALSTDGASPGAEIFDPTGLEFLEAGEDGGLVCSEDGTVLQNVISLDFHGCTVLPEVPGKASAAALFHGPSIIAFTAWVPSIDGFGMILLTGGTDNWTDVVPSGDPATTDHFFAVGNTGAVLKPIVPQSLVPQWGLGFPNLVEAGMFQAAWGKPVTAARPDRFADIVIACEPNLADPGNLVVISMGGDDTADSSALIGPTGKQPRVLRGLDGVSAVTCFGENILSLFRKTATGYEKVGDEIVGDGPLGLDVKRLTNGNVAFLCTGSRDDTWSVVIVNPVTGAVVSATTQAVPPECDEPTDCSWGEAGVVWILGKGTQKIVRFDAGVE